MTTFIAAIVWTFLLALGFGGLALAGEEHSADCWKPIAPFFTPPPEYRDDFGKFRSVLKFVDGRSVRTPQDWMERRSEIIKTWHDEMGQWPPLVEHPRIKFLAKTHKDTYTEYRVLVPIDPKHETHGYLLVPDGKGPFPALLVVFYEPETGAGLARHDIFDDYGRQLTLRGYVTLQIGPHGGVGGTYRTKGDTAPLQPLSYLAYEGANCCNALAALQEVDEKRIGVVGHSFGGKWAMFAACLYGKFAAGVWDDPGVAFDESDPNANYWEPWYLGLERDRKPRKPGVPTKDNPRTGAYKRLFEAGHDLHEVQALMAPRPFLVSGGSVDRASRWPILNHPRAVNQLLGHGDRVGMFNTRSCHRHRSPADNEPIYQFFDCFLKHGKGVTAAEPTAKLEAPIALWQKEKYCLTNNSEEGEGYEAGGSYSYDPLPTAVEKHPKVYKDAEKLSGNLFSEGCLTDGKPDFVEPYDMGVWWQGVPSVEITFALRQRCLITRANVCTLLTNSSGPSAIACYVSDDNKAYTRVGAIDQVDAGWNGARIDREARYVKIEMEKGEGKTYIHCTEVQIFGKPILPK